MIDSKALAAMVYEEAKYWASKSHYSDAPNLNEEHLFARMSSEAPLAPEAILAEVIEEAFWASLLAEEARPCRPRLIYAPGIGTSVHRLEEAVRLSREVLRKLGPAQGSGLVWEVRGGAPMIIGLHRMAPAYSSGVTIYVTGPGSIDVRWSNVRILSLRAGEALRISTVKLGNVESIAGYVANQLAAPEIGLLVPALEALMQQGHGGALWVVPIGACLDGITIQRPIAPDVRPSSERFASDQDRIAWLASLANLAAVDGAVVIDFDLRVIGFGAFVQLRKEPIPVQKWIPGGAAKLTNSGEGWGSRHRSAAEFCEQYKPAGAFVVSEDGGAHVFVAPRDGIVQCHPLVSLGTHRPLV